jgi:hypothetical protein
MHLTRLRVLKNNFDGKAFAYIIMNDRIYTASMENKSVDYTTSYSEANPYREQLVQDQGYEDLELKDLPKWMLVGIIRNLCVPSAYIHALLPPEKVKGR